MVNPAPGWYPTADPSLEDYWDGSQWAGTPRPVASIPPPSPNVGPAAVPGPTSPERPWYKKKRFIGGGVLAVLFLIAVATTDPSEPESETAAVETTTTAEQTTTTESAEPTTSIEQAVDAPGESTTTTVQASGSTVARETLSEDDQKALYDAAFSCTDALRVWDRAVASELLTPELDTATGSWVDQRLFDLDLEVNEACSGTGESPGYQALRTLLKVEHNDFDDQVTDLYEQQRDTNRAIKDWYKTGADRDLMVVIGDTSPLSDLWPDYDTYSAWFSSNYPSPY